ncbi:MAG: hypothetical protein KAU31_13660 [Spirochaetaceae bacterium]|nr:hypothetical protein [Spirochaetaceae bacterium]
MDRFIPIANPRGIGDSNNLNRMGLQNLVEEEILVAVELLRAVVCSDD